jgi:predicted NUDIX family phosphoesterase
MDAVERVGVVSRALAETLGLLAHGFSRLRDPDTLDRLEAELTFIDRPIAEDDPSKKQIIPYGILTREDRPFLMERLGGSGETRLHGKLSLGVGGHINPVDADGTVLATTMARELHEELSVLGEVVQRPIGFINDDTQPVGRVHLGVVFELTLAPGGNADVRETETLRGQFRPWSELPPLRSRMESWSSFLLDAFRQGLLN